MADQNPQLQTGITSNGSPQDETSPGGDGGQRPLTFQQVMDVLENGTFDTEHGAIRWSSNYTFLISLTHNDLSLLAVYKPRSGERPLWDFPDGTLCNRERATYVVSQTLGWQIVPPTVLRDGPRGYGSVQFFVEHDPSFNYFDFDASLTPQLKRLSIFDVLVNNADRKGGHCIVDGQDHLWGIDHGITFHSMNKLRTVIWNFAGDAVPGKMLSDVEKLCGTIETEDSDLRQEMNTLLNPREVQAFRKRIERTLKDGHYPHPGPGPNYPWPPV